VRQALHRQLHGLRNAEQLLDQRVAFIVKFAGIDKGFRVKDKAIICIEESNLAAQLFQALFPAPVYIGN